ncbi:hypothetical protein EJ08DRAFT_679215 [Tothia fuscella]|uniref:Store-operated calcium entry-associated regulatory factor n=1 Tax=Tothia fuscella TaxID=1048955 RepID=A0A9P4NRM9_9PEZI|nr:hypothetical protein EJ08DRAFT_679215 [Tothia fuscella]
MKLQFTLPSALLALLTLTSFISSASAARQPANSVLLRKVASLTLKKDQKTSHRRVSALPQLKCIGGSAKGLYEVDVMRCENSGAAYDEDNVEWTCKASLPPEFKLGSTDVICEGYSNPDDPYILKGSCGVEYRLILTEQGQEKYGKKSWWDNTQEHDASTNTDQFVATLFWFLFIGVLFWMVYKFVNNRGTNGAGGVNRPVGGGGGGGWGGGGGGGNDDPPPPYDFQGYQKPRSSYTRTPAAGEQGWRPGFWSGAAGGAAAGYMMGNRGNRQEPRAGSSWFGSGNGEGSSRGWGAGGGGGGWGSGGGGSSSAPSPSRHESTGFGSTRRR